LKRRTLENTALPATLLRVNHTGTGTELHIRKYRQFTKFAYIFEQVANYPATPNRAVFKRHFSQFFRGKVRSSEEFETTDDLIHNFS
jgi:hypothetical protein